MAERYRTIARHIRCHFDELVATVLLRRYGEAIFPGIAEAEIATWRNESAPNGKSAAELESEGIIPIGIGHGRFDEHLDGDHRIPGECAATLVAKELNIEEKPELQKLLKFTLRTDKGPALHPLDVSGVLKVIHKQYPTEPQIGEAWATEAINAIIEPFTARAPVKLTPLLKTLDITDPPFGKLVRFAERVDNREPDHPFDISSIARMMPAEKANQWLTTALTALRDGYRAFDTLKEECAKTAAVCEVEGKRGSFRVAAVESGNERIAAFARSKKGCDAAIVIQRNPSGNTQVFSDYQRVSETLFRFIAESIRVAEAKAGGNERTWYHHIRARTLLNGSTSHPDVPPTRLSLEELTKVVIEAIREFA